MSRHFMNPSMGKHMGDTGPGKHAEPDGDEGALAKKGSEREAEGGKHPQSIHIHHAGAGEPSPENAHHVHVHHADGSHEHSDHQNFQEAMDHAGSIGGPEGQDHGYSAGSEMEDEHGFGPGV